MREREREGEGESARKRERNRARELEEEREREGAREDSSKNAYGSEEILNAARDLSQSQQLTVSPSIIVAYSRAQLLSCRGSTTLTGQRI